MVGWSISILVFSMCCSLGGLLSYGAPVVVFLDLEHPCFWNFYSTIPVDVIRVKSYVNRFFEPLNIIDRLISGVAAHYFAGYLWFLGRPATSLSR